MIAYDADELAKVEALRDYYTQKWDEMSNQERPPQAVMLTGWVVLHVSGKTLALVSPVAKQNRYAEFRGYRKDRNFVRRRPVASDQPIVASENVHRRQS